jgi:hypothetical protein
LKSEQLRFRHHLWNAPTALVHLLGERNRLPSGKAKDWPSKTRAENVRDFNKRGSGFSRGFLVHAFSSCFDPAANRKRTGPLQRLSV